MEQLEKMEGAKYRMGAAYIEANGQLESIDSDLSIRHPIQNIAAHEWASPQPIFSSESNSLNPYYQSGVNFNSGTLTNYTHYGN